MVVLEIWENDKVQVKNDTVKEELALFVTQRGPVQHNQYLVTTLQENDWMLTNLKIKKI